MLCDKLNQPCKVMELLELSLYTAVYEFEVPMYVKQTLLQDVSRGLDYLHTRNPPIVHSYLTIDVILLTDNLVAKIGGFTFSVEVVPETKRLLSRAHPENDEVRKSSLYCGPPFDIYLFGWLICQAILQYRIHDIYKFLHIESFGKPLIVHAVNVGQYDYSINEIEGASLKQLVKDCVNNNGDLRPSASLIDLIIGNVIKGELISSPIMTYPRIGKFMKVYSANLKTVKPTL